MMSDFIDVVRIIQNVVWIMSSIFIIIALPALFYRPKRSLFPAKNVVLVIVSIASRRVRSSLYETINNVKEFAVKNGVEFRILIDEGAELEEELRREFKDKVIVVPRNYRRDLIGKGRAISYFVENFIREDYWYSFLDDDNLILSNDFLYEIPYYEKKGYVASNPVLLPRMGRNVITFIMDSIRFFDDLLFFRFFTGVLGKPLIGLHGELLTVKGSVLKEIGFCRKSFTEDFRFAVELVRRDYKTWQSRTRVSIKSPNSLKDLLSQRGRWFKGIFLDSFKAPLLMRIITSGRITTWIVGVIGTFALGLVIGVSYIPALTLPAGVYYTLAYLYGFFKYISQIGSIKKSRMLLLLLSLPFLGIIENISWIFGIRMRRFVVIDKN